MEDSNSNHSSDETISLCDLPLYGNNQIDHHQDQEQDHDQEDYFEFFTQDLAPEPLVVPENIVFCGKLISSKPSNSSNHDNHHPTKIKIKKRFFGWSWDLFSIWRVFGGEKRVETTSATLKHDERYNAEKRGDFIVREMPVLSTSSSGKGRWYLLLFGISRFSTKVDLRDFKNRRSRRRHHSSASESGDGGGDGWSKRGSRVWGFIRVLSCGANQNPNTMLVASIR
ncbi:uncharacterized protein LOC127243745 [Andrographis paniculata]|uniref:uncharacterized protein LOC127243745 n=1 Tax=Andrographis paniculata TaxID=175694 RepID=UPI0021E74B15|nr:uncharacterized protein LOC127243745 [Andrographis paniculata]